MIELWLRHSLRRQLFALVGMSIGAALLDYWITPTPLLRLKTALVVQGLFAGLLISFVVLTLHLIGFLFERTNHLSALRQLRTRFPSHDPWIFTGVFFFFAAEEVFFRGYVLNPLLPLGIPLAITLHALLAFVFLYAGRRAWLWTFVQLVEFCFLGYLFALTRSLAACVAAHVVVAALEEVFLRFTLSRYPTGASLRRGIRNSVLRSPA